MANATAPAPAREEIPPPLAVLELLNGLWVARAIQVAADLGIADLLCTGPRSVEELSDATATHAPSLHRLLRALTTVGIFTETVPLVYEQTPRSACLAAGHPASLRNAARMFGAPWQWRTWEALPHAVASGEAGFDHVHGVGLVEYLTDVDPEAGALFDGAMADMSRFLNRAVLAAYDFGACGVVTDVGGGHSTLLLDILRAHPALAGVMIDRYDVIERVRGQALETGLGERYRGVAGDIFVDGTAPADVVLLNRVLHDWGDGRARELLRACRRAVGASGGRLVIVEQLLEPERPSRRVAFMDLQMLQLRGGRERSEADFAELLRSAGFVLRRTIPTASPMSILEAEAA